MIETPKIKVMRVVTTSECVPWHLVNTIKRMTNDFEVFVVGRDVSQHKDTFPAIKWIDINIERKINFLSDIRSLYLLINIVLSIRPDIMHSIMPKAGMLTAVAGFVCRVPVRIHTFTGQVWATQTGFSRYILCLLDKIINVLNTVCLTDSHSQSLFLFDHKVGYLGKPLPVLSKGSLSGFDTEKISIQAISSRVEIFKNHLKIDKSDFVFAYIARKTRDKGAIDMIKAFYMVSNIFPRAKLLFVGPDETCGEIDEMVKSQPNIFQNILRIGKVDDHELYLAVSDVLCLPSYREGFGSIVIDAAALGLPSIGSNIVGLVDSIEDGKTGLLVPAGDLDKLTQAMCLFLKNPELCKQMGQAAKKRVETYFTADQLYNELKLFYLNYSFSSNKVKKSNI